MLGSHCELPGCTEEVSSRFKRLCPLHERLNQQLPDFARKPTLLTMKCQACRPEDTGCSACGGYKIVMQQVACSTCGSTRWERPGCYTTYEGKVYYSVDGVKVTCGKDPLNSSCSLCDRGPVPTLEARADHQERHNPFDGRTEMPPAFEDTGPLHTNFRCAPLEFDIIKPKRRVKKINKNSCKVKRKPAKRKKKSK